MQKQQRYPSRIHVQPRRRHCWAFELLQSEMPSMARGTFWMENGYLTRTRWLVAQFVSSPDNLNVMTVFRSSLFALRMK